MKRSHMLSLSLHEPQHAALEHATSPNAHGSLVYRRVRRQAVARGLARHHDTKGKEGHHKARMTRLQKQLAIIEDYRRQKMRSQEEQESAEGGTECESVSCFIPAVPATPFSRKISLHRLPANPSMIHSPNQLDDQSHLIAIPAVSKEIANTTSCYEGPQKHLIPSQTKPKVLPEKQIDNETKSSALDKTTAQVLCELKITKDIMMREHLVKQIHDAVATLEEVSKELHDLSMKKVDDEKLGDKPGSLTKRPSSSTIASSSQTSSKQQKKVIDVGGDATDRDRDSDSQAFVSAQAGCALTAHRRIAQLHRLLMSHQVTTVELVESIIEWRKHKTTRGEISNAAKLHRFSWRKRHIINYLAHIGSDLRDLFPSAAMSVLLGLNARHNPLLLPRAVMDELGIPEDSFISTTFLTERRDKDAKGSGHEAPSPTRRQCYFALHNAVNTVDISAGSDPQVDASRLRRCLEAIGRECELEEAAAHALASEKIRLERAYNPFESIRNAGGVEDTIASVIARHSSTEMLALSEELRHRQEDVQRTSDAIGGQASEYIDETRATSLHVNPVRIRRLIEQRKEVRDASTDCELVDAATLWKKNKLRGQVMVRKMNVYRVENQHARKIQKQFQAYRRRTQLLKSLARLVIISRQRIVSIQKLVRGFLAKKRYNEERQRLDLERLLRNAAKIIWYTYKRFKRRQHHRHSMSVEAVAQIQLLQVIQHQLEDAVASETSSAERYRKIGEDRRRQQAVHLLKRRREMLELEAKRVAAAVRIQSFFRMHLAKAVAHSLRSERRTHLSAVSAMMIQSKIRKFLKRQEGRRQRFRSDLERVNRSAVRIQSIYRGYNSRASLVVELEESLRSKLSVFNHQVGVDEDEDDEDTEPDDPTLGDAAFTQDQTNRSTLPPIVLSRPSSGRTASFAKPAYFDVDEIDEDDDDNVHLDNLHAMIARSSPPKVSLPPIRPRAASVHQLQTRKAQPPPVRRQTSNGTMKVELKLKETTLGDDLDVASSANTPGGFLGPLRRRLRGNGSGSGSFKGPLPTQ